MAKKNKRAETENREGLKAGTKHAILSVIFFVLTIFFLLSALKVAGVAGEFFYEKLRFLLGVGYALLPILFALLGFSYLRARAPDFGWVRAVSSAVFLLSGLGIIDILSKAHSGGLLGRVLPTPLVSLFDIYASLVFLLALLLISILVTFDATLSFAWFTKIREWLGKRKKEPETEREVEVKINEPEVVEEIKEEQAEIKGAPMVPNEVERDEEEFPKLKAKKLKAGSYTPPPLSLLEGDQGSPATGDIKANANIIKRTLQNFGIEVEMDEVTVGPTVTRYALKPAEGVKLSRIVGLQSDLALALAAHPLRIEAPIPGKSLVGIEIPNRAKSIVGLGSLLSDDKFKNSTRPLTIALGREISGRAIFGNLGKMPHLLVAGATGAGKSVTIHSMITSLLYRNSPDELKFIMIDPKRVELTLYNNIPHLLTPVITEPKKAILALKWAAKEMDRRYDILEAESVRDIDSYQKNIEGKAGEETESLPFIVVIIDELADIMSTYPRELESAIVRLAQMSRAVGIHLILSTQRPEVNVITGLIKANIPARVALKVSSQIDSRTILDTGGAEKLLGAGDMLYSSGEAPPERLQSAFISEGEVKKVVKYLADNYADEVMGDITLSEGQVQVDTSIFESMADESGEEDEMYEEAKVCVVEAGKASTSYLQRRLKLGYARAARLMDMLEERGVIGPGEGAKPREVLLKKE